eukprot:1745331-Prymnesium_polylepis.1
MVAAGRVGAATEAVLTAEVVEVGRVTAEGLVAAWRVVGMAVAVAGWEVTEVMAARVEYWEVAVPREDEVEELAERETPVGMEAQKEAWTCLLYTSPSPRDAHES